MHQVTDDAGGAAVADEHGDVLLASGRITHRSRADSQTRVELPEALTGGCVVCRQISVCSALEDQIARRGECAAIPERAQRNPPALLLPHWIPGEEGTLAIQR